MKKILLVEDSAVTVELLRLELKHLGYESIVIARDGKRALEMAVSDAPDLIIMDMSLPEIDGIEATSILRKDPKTRFIPILAATARALPGDRQKCLQAGCDEYIAKPFTHRELGSMIKKILKD